MSFEEKIAEKSKNLPENVRALNVEEAKSVNGGVAHFGKGCVGDWFDGNGFRQACQP